MYLPQFTRTTGLIAPYFKDSVMLAKLLIRDELVWNRSKVEEGKYPIERGIGLERTKLSVVRVIQQKVELMKGFFKSPYTLLDQRLCIKSCDNFWHN
jgi:hypothetical protein